MANTTITEISVKEFKKHFNKLPINYKSASGNEFITFITTVDIFNQLFPDTPLNKVTVAIDRSGYKCNFIIRNYNDPSGEFKMIISIHNKITNERIALIAA